MTVNSRIEDINMSSHLLIYMDVLGCKNLIKEEKDNEILKFFYRYYEMVKSQAIYRRLYEPERKVKIFSDNIIIAEEFNHLTIKKEWIGKILNSFLKRVVQSSQFYLLITGLYVRGAVHLGDLYIDETFVYGKSLLEAYEIETNVAKYPRVVLSPEFIQVFNDHIEQLISEKILAKDFDGQIYVDYFDFEGDDGGRFPVLLEQIRNSIMWSYQKSNHDARVQKKIQWVIEKFNQECLRSDRESYLIRDII
jgi:hypothetical protein